MVAVQGCRVREVLILALREHRALSRNEGGRALAMAGVRGVRGIGGEIGGLGGDHFRVHHDRIQHEHHHH